MKLNWKSLEAGNISKNDASSYTRKNAKNLFYRDCASKTVLNL